MPDRAQQLGVHLGVGAIWSADGVAHRREYVLFVLNASYDLVHTLLPHSKLVHLRTKVRQMVVLDSAHSGKFCLLHFHRRVVEDPSHFVIWEVVSFAKQGILCSYVATHHFLEVCVREYHRFVSGTSKLDLR